MSKGEVMKLKAKTEIAKRLFNGREYIELEDSTYAPIDYILRWCNETNINFKNNFEIIRY